MIKTPQDENNSFIETNRVHILCTKILISGCVALIGMLLTNMAVGKLLGVAPVDSLYHLVIVSSLGGLITGLATYFMWQVTKMSKDEGIWIFPHNENPESDSSPNSNYAGGDKSNQLKEDKLEKKEILFFLSLAILMILWGYGIYCVYSNP